MGLIEKFRNRGNTMNASAGGQEQPGAAAANGWEQLENADTRGQGTTWDDLKNAPSPAAGANMATSANRVNMAASANAVSRSNIAPRQKFPEAVNTSKFANALETANAPEAADPRPPELYREPLEIGYTTPERQAEVLEQYQLDGALFTQFGQEKLLTPEVLRDNDLAPTYAVNFENRMVLFSKPFENRPGSDSVIAYIADDEGQIYPRSYYQSRSQGVWRYLPDYLPSRPNGDGVDRYGKGYSEQSVDLPIHLQHALAQITAPGQPRAEITDDPVFLLAGTAKPVYERSGAYYEEVSSRPVADIDNAMRSALDRINPFAAMDTSHPIPPEAVQIPAGQEPDYTNRLDHWRTEMGMYGQVQVDCYPSKDGGLEYMMCRDEQGRSWISHIEAHTPVTSTGLRAGWVNSGDLAMPLYEYRAQSGKYGDPNDEKGVYISMQPYLSQIKVIQDYQNMV